MYCFECVLKHEMWRMLKASEKLRCGDWSQPCNNCVNVCRCYTLKGLDWIENDWDIDLTVHNLLKKGPAQLTDGGQSPLPPQSTLPPVVFPVWVPPLPKTTPLQQVARLGKPTTYMKLQKAKESLQRALKASKGEESGNVHGQGSGTSHSHLEEEQYDDVDIVRLSPRQAVAVCRIYVSIETDFLCVRVSPLCMLPCCSLRHQGGDSNYLFLFQ